MTGSTSTTEVTRLLALASRGDRDAVDRLVPILYEELRRIAHQRMRGERVGHTLETTALVHEAYLELAGLDRMEWQSRAHFLAVAARAMRRVLIDHAVARNAQKRAGKLQAVPLDEVPDLALVSGQRADELLALDEALDRLAGVSERQARVVECRFFAGMSVEETAEALGTSPATVKRDWTVARAWLYRELGT
ncbi:MAG TPA: sigma-70 family RNA polymerase sigma factor [Gemmatimonadaceae bacterium]|nr:sigma-70 family RNA polymerase sigma factor [Gemmatimonadaceae bacterium]